MNSMELTTQDDSLHQPANDDPFWSETHWFSFDQPGSNLSTTIYPFFRKNLNIAQVSVYFWDPSAHEPWLVRYGKAYWHLPYPDMDVTALRLGDLEYDCVEPLKKWVVRYRDGEQVQAELEFEGLQEAHLESKNADAGHLDQPCKVTGYVALDGQRYDIDTLGMRDKSWGIRTDIRTGNPLPNGVTGGAYTFGNQAAGDHFLVRSLMMGNTGQVRPGGYYIRDGKSARLASGERRVLERRNGYPVEVEVSFEDELGRSLSLRGTSRNRLADYAFSTTFAWLSMTEYRTADGETFLGEDQEVFGPYTSGPRMAALNTQ